MNSFHITEQFDAWLINLKDSEAQKRIVARLERAINGNFGDYKSIGGGLYEMRIDYGGGYRVYYKQIGKTIYFLLCGGDKSTQNRDIKMANKLAGEIKIEE